MTSFQTDKKHLTYLLDQIEQGDAALPDFQRDFVWEANATRELIRSVMQSFPAGTLLMMQSGARHFRPRSFAEAPALNGDPTYLVLDGQQRLTSLSLAFTGRGTHRYFLNLQELLDGEDLDEAVEVYPLRRVGTWSTREGQAKYLVLPLADLRRFADWRDEILEIREEKGFGDDPRKLRRQLNELEKLYVKPVEQYQFPVTTLASDTGLEAVCTIFETLNRTGVKLSVFDLLTARGFAQGVHLRDLWDHAQATHPILVEFGIDPYYLLQVVATWAKGDPRRGTVLRLDVSKEVEPLWEDAAASLAAALQMLQTECGILTPTLLPYGTMLLTMAGSWPAVAEATGPDIGARRERLMRWFWTSTFLQRYENQANTRTQTDVPALTGWLRGTGEAPIGLDGTFDRSSFRSITKRQQALYRACMGLSLRHQPRDFHEGRPLTPQRIAEEQVDDHHIFPRAYLAAAAPQAPVESVLNRTLIDRITNIRISAKAPSVYLREMEQALTQAQLDRILESHGLPADRQGPFFTDDFEGFLKAREERLAGQLSAVTGWAV